MCCVEKVEQRLGRWAVGTATTFACRLSDGWLGFGEVCKKMLDDERYVVLLGNFAKPTE